MTVPIWPWTLPLPTQSGYGYTQKAASVRTEMDSGTARVRRRYTRVPTQLTLRWMFKDMQLAIFERFWRKELLDGAAWFDVKALTGTGWQSLRVRPVSDGYQVVMPSPGVAEVSLQVEALEMPLMADAHYEMVQTFGTVPIVWLDQALQQLVHVSLPGAQSWSTS